MREPNLRTSRLAIAGGFVAAMVIGTVGFLVGRTTISKPAQPVAAVAKPPIAASPEPASPRVLRRADIIAFANAAADAVASGLPVPQSIMELGGRRFDVAIPFGCNGPAAASNSAPMRWQYDAASRTLRVQIVAQNWKLADWGLADAQEPGGVAEGFWLDRPWSSAENCPNQIDRTDATSPHPITVSEQTLALAHLELTGSQSKARNALQSFDVVRRMEPEELNVSQGLRLRLTGRIENLAGTKPVHCLLTSRNQRPTCVVAASFEEATVEAAASGRVIATWSLGQLHTSD